MSSANLGSFPRLPIDFQKSSLALFSDLRLSTYFFVSLAISESIVALLQILSSIANMISLIIEPHSILTSRLSDWAAFYRQRLKPAPTHSDWIKSGTMVYKSALRISFLIDSTPILTSSSFLEDSFSMTALLSELTPWKFARSQFVNTKSWILERAQLTSPFEVIDSTCSIIFRMKGLISVVETKSQSCSCTNLSWSP